MADEIVQTNPAEKYAAWIVQNADKKGTPEFNTVVQAYSIAKQQLPQANVEVSSPEGQPLSTQFGNTGGGAAVGRPQGIDRTNVLAQPRPLESAMAGATKSVIDPFVAGAQMVTRGNLGTSELAKKLGEEANVYAEENPVWYGSGRVAGALAPAMAMSKGIGVIPSFAKLGPYAQAAGVGAIQGALTPEETGKKDLELLRSELQNTALGATLAAPTPLLGKIAKTAYGAGKAALEPFNQQGRNLILGRALRQFSGNDAEQAIQNLRNAKELVLGSKPTVAEAAGVPSLAAAQRAVLNSSTEATNALTNRQTAQNVARIEAIENIKPPKEAIKELREKATEDLYNRANSEKIIATPEIKNLLARPSMEKALARAKNLAKEKGEDLEFVKEIPSMASSILDANGKPLGNIPATEGSLLGKAAHYIKRGLDDLTNYPHEHGISGNELNAIKDTKKQFLNAIETQLPTYKAARETYAQLSKPISQADVIEEIAKSANFRGNLTPAALIRALKDETAKRATGQANATLENTLAPDQMAVLQNIKQDLLNSDFAQTAGRGVGSNTMQNLAYNNMLQEVNLPNLLRRRGLAETAGNIAARVKDVAYGSANKRLTSEMVETMLDPRKAAALMKLAKKQPLEAQASPEQARLAKLLFTQGGVNAVNAIRGQNNE